MKRKKREDSGKNLKVVAFFCFFVFLLIAISLLIKISFVIYQSRFDGLHRFNILMMPSTGPDTKNINFELISFAPEANSIVVLNLLLKTSGKSINIKDVNVGKILKIPIDGTIKFRSLNQGNLINDQNIDKKLQTIFLHYQNLDTKVTIIDIARLWLFTKKMSSRSVSFKDLTISIDSSNSLDNLSIEREYSQLFLEDALLQEKMTIQIINGTRVFGLGNRLAKLITNMGGNVIVVSTSDEIVDDSGIAYFGKKTYTLKRLNEILGFTTKEMYNQGISDIVITIGKNSLDSLMF